MARIKGHWFCDHCDDVIFMAYERIDQRDVPCPACGRLACNFIPEKINRATLGAYWFDAMRRAADATPELPSQETPANKKRL